MTQNIKTTINTNGNITTTGVASGGITTISGVTGTIGSISINGYNYISNKPLKEIFYCLGEEIEIESVWQYEDLKTNLSLITVIGIELYGELKKNRASFPKEVTKMLDIKYQAWIRSSRIDSILED